MKNLIHAVLSFAIAIGLVAVRTLIAPASKLASVVSLAFSGVVVVIQRDMNKQIKKDKFKVVIKGNFGTVKGKKSVLVTGYGGYREWKTVYYNHFKVWNVTKKITYY